MLLSSVYVCGRSRSVLFGGLMSLSRRDVSTTSRTARVDIASSAGRVTFFQREIVVCRQSCRETIHSISVGSRQVSFPLASVVQFQHNTTFHEQHCSQRGPSWPTLLRPGILVPRRPPPPRRLSWTTPIPIRQGPFPLSWTIFRSRRTRTCTRNGPAPSPRNGWTAVPTTSTPGYGRCSKCTKCVSIRAAGLHVIIGNNCGSVPSSAGVGEDLKGRGEKSTSRSAVRGCLRSGLGTITSWSGLDHA